MTALQVQLVGFGVAGQHLGETVRSALPSCSFKAVGNLAGNLVLDFENIIERAVVGFRPQMHILADIDQLRGDPHLLAGGADAAFQYVIDAKPRSNRRDIEVFTRQ